MAKRKRKKKRKQTQQQASVRKEVNKFALVVTGVGAATCVGIGALAYFYGDYYDYTEQWEAIASSASDASVAAATAVRESLEAETGSARVFDSNENLIFTLRGSSESAGVDEVPAAILSAVRDDLLGASLYTPLDLDNYISAQTRIGKLLGNSNEDALVGSLGYQVLDIYLSRSGLSLEDTQKVVVAAYLDSQFDEATLLSYVASGANYGRVTGLANACDQYFNKTVPELNEWQISYLAYAVLNSDASWTEFLEQYPDSTGGATTAEAFGFASTGGDTLWALKQAVREELSTIEGVDLESGHYNIQLEFNSSLQAELQEDLDSSFRTSIDLDSTGSTVLDGTVCVVDSHTGFVTALVGSRSTNTVSTEFKLNSVSMIGTMDAARQMLAEDPALTYTTLVPYELETGEVNYASFGAIAMSNQLSILGVSPTLENTTTISELSDFLASLMVDTGARFIREVQDSEGNVLYSAPAAIDISQQSPSLDILGMLAGNTGSTTTADMSWDTEVGTVFGRLNSEHIVCALLGTKSVGYTLDAEDYDLCITATIPISRTVEEYYPRTPSNLDRDNALTAKLSVAEAENRELLSGLVAEWVVALEEQPINSVGTRNEFETLYSNYSYQLWNYTALFTDTSIYTELQAELDAVRSARSEELLRYVA